MFFDEAKIQVKAGDGGNGCMAFRREKFVPRGGPSGGDGGRGGHIYIESNLRHNTLVQFRYERVFKAKRGKHGEGSNRHGRNGDDLIIQVPVGTVIYDDATGEVLHDYAQPNQKIAICQGGRGGRGNARFTSSVNRAPRRVETGFPGDEKSLRLELKLIADVGLIGLPNVGKSTLISRISSARPKIGDYPFTTLEPNLGVVEFENYRSFVVADIPGLIEGSHLGQGLGLRFLKHVERTKLLLHLIDLSENHAGDPRKDWETVNRELREFNPAILEKPMLLVGSKLDALEDAKRRRKLERLAKAEGYDLILISSATGKGIETLKHKVAEMLAKIPGTPSDTLWEPRTPPPDLDFENV